MTLTTSYFANLKNIETPVAICSSTPDWYHGENYPSLAPHPKTVIEFKKGRLSKEDFIIEFEELILDGLDAQHEYDQLRKTYGDNVTLICYEKAGCFCHRRLVASWFEKELGIVVPELRTVNNNKLIPPKRTLF